MIYEIVNFIDGERFEDSRKYNLNQLKKNLGYCNRGALIVNRQVLYAIACYLPSQAVILVGSWVVPVKISELTSSQQKAFWNWYGEGLNTYEIPSIAAAEDFDLEASA